MPTTYEGVGDNGHYTFAQRIFYKIKSWIDAQGYITQHQDISGKVNKSGDTMTGNLTIDRTSPAFNNKYSDIDLTKANNGGTTRTAWFRILDKNSQYVFVSGTQAVNTGEVNSYFRVYNQSTGGSNTYQHEIRLTVDKSGNKSVGIDAAPWRTALALATTNNVEFHQLTVNDQIVKATGNIQIRAGSDSNTVYLRGAGVQVIKVGSMTYVNVTAAAFNTGSSERIKENIEDLTEEEARKLLDIRTVTFDYKEGWGGGVKNQRGVIAEEVIDVIPTAVTIPEGYDPDKPLDVDNPPIGVDYSKFVPYLIKMVQSQQKEIDELREIVNELRKENYL